MQLLSWTVVVKRELRHKAKLSVYRSAYIPYLTYSHELWVMTETMRVQIQAAEISFLPRVVGYTPLDRMRSSVIWEELKVELLLHHTVLMLKHKNNF